MLFAGRLFAKRLMVLRCLAAASVFVALGNALLPVQAVPSSDEPTLQRGESVNYLCERGERLEATYYALSDQSLAFVRLRLPDGRQLTLPQIASASGARFSADSDVTWWIKGNSGSLQQRNAQGAWSVTLKDCDSVA